MAHGTGNQETRPERDVVVQDNPEAQRFEASVGNDMAIAEYRLVGNAIMFTHTEVPESLEGRGIGSQLVREALESARARDLAVIPMCSFVADYIREHRDYLELVHPTHRAALDL